LGFPTTGLYEQTRMAPQIAGVVDGLVYDGKIENSPRVRQQYRGAQKGMW
jgi:hypothetical protein